MADWTLTTAADTYTFERDDGTHKYVVRRCDGTACSCEVNHFHAEEYMAWPEDGIGRTTPEMVRDWYQDVLLGRGDTVTEA